MVESQLKGKTSNTQHPTSNIQRANAPAFIGCWVLDVGCWMLDVHLISSHGVSDCKLHALPSSVSMCTSSLKLLSTRQSIRSNVMPQGPLILSPIWSPAFTP